jgi:hypothetical protein
MLLYIVVKMDGEIWPGNVLGGERVVTCIRPGVVRLALVGGEPSTCLFRERYYD